MPGAPNENCVIISLNFDVVISQNRADGYCESVWREYARIISLPIRQLGSTPIEMQFVNFECYTKNEMLGSVKSDIPSVRIVSDSTGLRHSRIVDRLEESSGFPFAPVILWRCKVDLTTMSLFQTF
jgi:hypothetical protein